MNVQDFPPLNASLNGAAAVLMTIGFICIRAKKVQAHRFCMMCAFVVSAVFLACYVTYHWMKHGRPTPFGGVGIIRPIYFSMLISHIILAIVIVPMILVTLRHALKGDFEKHRRLARWTFPLWYYVSITGVLVYFFLYRWWPAAV